MKRSCEIVDGSEQGEASDGIANYLVFPALADRSASSYMLVGLFFDGGCAAIIENLCLDE